jgi:hypothetical protein
LLQVISTVGVALRFYARRKTGAQLWVDDWLVLTGWVPLDRLAPSLKLTGMIDPVHDQKLCELLHDQTEWWTTYRMNSREPSRSFEDVPQVHVRHRNAVSAHNEIDQMQHLLALYPHL